VKIDELRAQWNDVLNQLEKSNRIAWIAFFDARLAKVDGGKVLLDFSDAHKFPGSLEYSHFRSSHREELERAIYLVTGATFSVEELR
jgi:hypothetical protein